MGESKSLDLIDGPGQTSPSSCSPVKQSTHPDALMGFLAHDPPQESDVLVHGLAQYSLSPTLESHNSEKAQTYLAAQTVGSPRPDPVFRVPAPALLDSGQVQTRPVPRQEVAYTAAVCSVSPGRQHVQYAE